MAPRVHNAALRASECECTIGEPLGELIDALICQYRDNGEAVAPETVEDLYGNYVSGFNGELEIARRYARDFPELFNQPEEAEAAVSTAVA